jgi:hypothetical protein
MLEFGWGNSPASRWHCSVLWDNHSVEETVQQADGTAQCCQTITWLGKQSSKQVALLSAVRQSLGWGNSPASRWHCSVLWDNHSFGETVQQAGDTAQCCETITRLGKQSSKQVTLLSAVRQSLVWGSSPASRWHCSVLWDNHSVGETVQQAGGTNQCCQTITRMGKQSSKQVALITAVRQSLWMFPAWGMDLETTAGESQIILNDHSVTVSSVIQLWWNECFGDYAAALSLSVAISLQLHETEFHWGSSKWTFQIVNINYKMLEYYLCFRSTAVVEEYQCSTNFDERKHSPNNVKIFYQKSDENLTDHYRQHHPIIPLSKLIKISFSHNTSLRYVSREVTFRICNFYQSLECFESRNYRSLHKL